MESARYEKDFDENLGPRKNRQTQNAAKQPLFQNFIGDIVRQWPLQPRRRRPFQIVLDRAARNAKKSPDLARAHAIVVKPQILCRDVWR